MHAVVTSGAFWYPLGGTLAVALLFFVAAFFFARASRKINGGAYRSLFTTALTVSGLLLPTTGAVLVYVVRLGKVSESALLFAALTLFPCILIVGTIALAGSFGYADEEDVIDLKTKTANGFYTGLTGALYILMLGVVGSTSAFFVLHTDALIAPGARPAVSMALNRQPARVGDTRKTVLDLWGKPDSTSKDLRFLFYARTDTVIVVALDAKDTVRSVLLGGK